MKQIFTVFKDIKRGVFGKKAKGIYIDKGSRGDRSEIVPARKVLTPEEVEKLRQVEDELNSFYDDFSYYDYY